MNVQLIQLLYHRNLTHSDLTDDKLIIIFIEEITPTLQVGCTN